MRRIILILSLLFSSQLITASNLLIEAESFDQKGGWVVAHYPLNIFSEIPFYMLSLYISYLYMFSFGLNTHEISRF